MAFWIANIENLMFFFSPFLYFRIEKKDPLLFFSILNFIFPGNFYHQFNHHQANARKTFNDAVQHCHQHHCVQRLRLCWFTWKQNGKTLRSFYLKLCTLVQKQLKIQKQLKLKTFPFWSGRLSPLWSPLVMSCIPLHTWSAAFSHDWTSPLDYREIRW